MDGGWQPERGDTAVTSETLQSHGRSGQVRQRVVRLECYPIFLSHDTGFGEMMKKNGLSQHRRRIEKLCLPIPLFLCQSLIPLLSSHNLRCRFRTWCSPLLLRSPSPSSRSSDSAPTPIRASSFHLRRRRNNVLPVICSIRFISSKGTSRVSELD